jgi:hypothetical protein
MFEEVEMDDFYVNMKLERTYDLLNTLSIRNTTTDEFPTQEATEGVVFGKLEAIQKLKDDEHPKYKTQTSLYTH